MAQSGGGARPEALARAPGPELAEARYRALVQNFPNSAIILCDPELRLVLVDGPEVAATGFSKAAMEGRTIYEALPADFVPLIEGNLRRVLAGESFTAEIPFGDRFYLYNYVPIRDEQGTIAYGLMLATNVTERRRAELALRRSEERFAGIFHASPDAIGVSKTSDGTLVEVNPAFESMFGYTRAEALGKTSVELGLWFDPDRRREIISELLAHGKVDGLEMPTRRRDGIVLDGLISLRLMALEEEGCLFFICRDVSEQKRAARALAASEARLRGLSEAAFEGIGIAEGGRIVDANDQLAHMVGRTPGELIGLPVTDLVAPESVALVRAKMAEGGEDAYEHLSIRADGTVFPVEVRGRKTVIDGRTFRMTAVRDVTERKRAEAERDRLIGELRARNAEMEQFAYTVSHDLKSPLVTINGFLGMLERDLAEGDGERVRGDLARIGSAASKMMRLLNDLLELSRVGRVTHTPSEVSLGEIVQEALELLGGPVRERNVKVAVAPDLPVVSGDRVRLVQVVQNLVENAVKYMGDEPHPVVEIGVRPHETNVVCFVRDNGIGVDPKYAERIFGLFEKLDPRSEGTGVGLSLVRRIVDFHGGTVSVESDGKTGSTFVFHLPRPATLPGRDPP